ncbi:hypothetical protein [Tsukamurella sp. 1534]|uniref:hypothetical protein n=1 Tax=Tsukamurella sp. 1534 TaxID=1151061 RepID=UPI0002D61AA9|nr:hypothetical protein [Tsukamurella sp. 1534]
MTDDATPENPETADAEAPESPEPEGAAADADSPTPQEEAADGDAADAKADTGTPSPNAEKASEKKAVSTPKRSAPGDTAGRAPARAAAEPARAAAPSSTRTVALTVVVTLLAILAGVSTFFAFRYHGELRDTQQAAADRTHAEDVAGKYATSVSSPNYNDLAPWLSALKANASEDVAKRFDAIAETMRQILVPMRYVATGSKLVVTKVTNEADGTYKVTAVVEVSATTVVAPQGTVATTAYDITVDRDQDWKITDVGTQAGGFPGTGAAPGGATPSSPAAPAPAPGG